MPRYLSFLEQQLERVSAACLSVEGTQDQFNGVEEKVGFQPACWTRLLSRWVCCWVQIVGLTRVVRLTQELQQQTEADFAKATSHEFIQSRRAESETIDTMASSVDARMQAKETLRQRVEMAMSSISVCEVAPCVKVAALLRCRLIDPRIQDGLNEMQAKLDDADATHKVPT